MTDGLPDKPFLVCYDYGTGGLWGVLMAPSDAAIRAKYPELVIAGEPPAWMSPDRHRALAEEPLWLHDEPPQGFFMRWSAIEDATDQPSAHAALSARTCRKSGVRSSR